MKDIKFRGKVLKEGVWLIGNLLFINDAYYIYPENYGDLEDIDFGYGFEEVIPSSVGQYTVLKDKNGKEIFDGDILTLYDSFSLSAYEVRWSTGRFELHTEDDGYGNPNTEEIWGSYDMKIIGNIHETPELLNRSNSAN